MKWCQPATPGPLKEDLNHASSAARFSKASPKSAAKLPELRQQLFGIGITMPTRAMAKTQTSQELQETTPPLPGGSSEQDFLVLLPSLEDS